MIRIPRTTDKNYLDFLAGKTFVTIPRKLFIEKLDGIRYVHKTDANKPARVACILLWMTGARPNEVLRLRAGDFTRTTAHLIVQMPGSKGGNSRPIRLPLHDKLVIEIDDFVKDKYAEWVVFWQLQSKTIKNGTTRSFKSKGLNGEEVWKAKRYEKKYADISSKFAKSFRQWFDMPIYYLRHNRFTVAAEKLAINDLKDLKGAKSESSLMKYMHHTEKAGKRIAKELTKWHARRAEKKCPASADNGFAWIVEWFWWSSFRVPLSGTCAGTTIRYRIHGRVLDHSSILLSTAR